MSERNYVPAIIISPADDVDTLNTLIGATGIEGATAQSLGAPVWDESTPVILDPETGWPDLAAMPPPEFRVATGFIHIELVAELPDDTVVGDL
jgi:hypothetical protein